MNTEALRKFIKEYQLGLRDDIEILGSYFENTWCFVDEDGYELTLLYGRSLYAIFYNHRKLGHLSFDIISESDPLKDLVKCMQGIEQHFGISLQEYYSRILGEFSMVIEEN
jgi:hypothetical protein